MLQVLRLSLLVFVAYAMVHALHGRPSRADLSCPSMEAAYQLRAVEASVSCSVCIIELSATSAPAHYVS